MTGCPWQSEQWWHTGRQIRDAWRALRRLSLQSWPVRVDWPPGMSPDKSFRTSHPERAAERLDEAERRFDVKRQEVNDAIAELSRLDHEAFLALARQEGLLKGERALSLRQIAERHRCSETRVHLLLRTAWAYVAWRIDHEAQGEAES